MLAPIRIVHDDPPSLLGDVRRELSLRPILADYPERLAAELEAAEQAFRACLEALEVEGEVLA
jgi:hypothetical protein